MKRNVYLEEIPLKKPRSFLRFFAGHLSAAETVPVTAAAERLQLNQCLPNCRLTLSCRSHGRCSGGSRKTFGASETSP